MNIVVDKDLQELSYIFGNNANFNLLSLAPENIRKENIILADALFLRSVTKIDDTLLKDTNVKFVASLTSGEDHIDHEMLKKTAINLSTGKGGNTSAVVEYFFSALSILLIEKKIIPYKTKIGIIGFGRIGKKMAKIYSSFGCRVSFYDISNLDGNKNINRYDNLEDIFKNSDIISLHASYSNENHEMINYKLFSLCKPSSIFINTARGGLVCEKSMIKALVNKKIAGAAIDVISEENNFNKNNHLVKYINNNDNLIITPHLGGCTFESSEKAELAITEHFLTYLK